MLKKFFSVIIMACFLLAACTDTNKETKEESTKVKTVSTEVKESTYTAEDVYTWFVESGLIPDVKKDVTKEYKGKTEGIVQAIDADGVWIYEFETEEQVKARPSSDHPSYKNIQLVIAKGSKDAFKQVLEAGKPLTNIKIAYASEGQQKVAELIQEDADFLPTIEAYYELKDDKTPTWDGFMYGKIVTWSGTIADLEAIGDSIVVYGGENYNGEDWSMITQDENDLAAYTFIVELKDESEKSKLKKGSKITLRGSLEARGDKDLKYNWKLYEGEVVK